MIEICIKKIIFINAIENTYYKISYLNLKFKYKNIMKINFDSQSKLY